MSGRRRRRRSGGWAEECFILDAVSDHFIPAVRLRSGVERFHVHQLRHTYACQWLERGGSLAALQQVLGHATTITTPRYARLSDDLVLREAERIEGQGAAKGVASEAGR